MGGGLYVKSRACPSMCCPVCLFVSGTMQRDHTVLVACGISRLKIAFAEWWELAGQEQAAGRGAGGREQGKRQGIDVS